MTATRPRALLIFPSASLTFMQGSIGELTALMRAVEASQGNRFRWRYAELIGGPDALTRSRLLMESVGCRPLVSARNRDDLNGMPLAEIRKRLGQALRFRPDVVVLSSFRAFLQFPRFPSLIEPLFDLLSRHRIPTLILDPCGDTLLCPALADHDVLLPAPFTYRHPHLRHQRIFSALLSPQEDPPAPDGEWLWLAAPWMRGFLRFRIAERIGLGLLADLGASLSTLGALEDPRDWLPGCTVIEDSIPFRELEDRIARKTAVVTANARSVLAARAASWGVPVVVVDPTRLPSKRRAQAHGVSSELLEAAEQERLPEFPIPAEVVTLETAHRAALGTLRRIQRDESEGIPARRERRQTYDAYPDFAQVLAEYV
jgi:hypothetical protein